MRAAAFLLLPLALWGASLETLKQKAAEHPQVVAAQQRLERALAEARLSGHWENPMVEFELSDIMLSDPLDRSMAGQMSAVSIAQKIPAWGKLPSQQNRALAEAEAVRADTESIRRDVTRQALASAYGLEAARQEQAILRQSRELAQELVRLAGVYQGTARGDHLTLARAELFRDGLDLRLHDAQAAIETQLARLEDLTALRPDRVLLTLAPQGALPDTAALIERLEKNSPQLKAARARAEAGRFGAQAAQAAKRPDLTVRLGYANVTENEDYLFVRFEAPLTFLGREGLAHQSARAQFGGAASAEGALRRELTGRLQSAHAAATAAADRYALIEHKLLPQARHLYDLAKARYESGGSGLDEAYRTLLEILDLQLRAVKESLLWHENRLMIEALTGEGV